MKFKVGDKVRQTKPYCYSELEDCVGTITYTYNVGAWPYHAKIKGTDYVYGECELEFAGEQQLEFDL